MTDEYSYDENIYDVDLYECCLLQVDACVFGVGTGGTITGVGTFLREKNPNIKV